MRLQIRSSRPIVENFGDCNFSLAYRLRKLLYQAVNRFIDLSPETSRVRRFRKGRAVFNNTA